MILTCRIEVPVLKKLIALLFVSASAPALAHLTWIDVGEQSLGLSTGHNFPAKEITVKGEYVQSVECVNKDGAIFNLPFDDNSIRYTYKERPANCLATLKTTLIELSPRQGAQHFEENKVRQSLGQQGFKKRQVQRAVFQGGSNQACRKRWRFVQPQDGPIRHIKGRRLCCVCVPKWRACAQPAGWS